MWNTSIYLFQHTTRLTKITTRRRFDTATMGEPERATAFISSLRQFASERDRADVTIDYQEFATAVVCRLPQVY